MKDKINKDDVELRVPSRGPGGASFDTITAECHSCGEEHVGVGTPVVMVMPGMIFPSTEYDCPVFVPDPDVQFRIIQMPNGMMGFVTDEKVTKYQHADCYENLIDEVAYAVHEDDIDEDDEDETESYEEDGEE